MTDKEWIEAMQRDVAGTEQLMQACDMKSIVEAAMVAALANQPDDEDPDDNQARNSVA